MSKEHLHCRRPDRHVPESICGYPLPCPWHTAIIDTTCDPATVTVPVTSEPAHNPALLGKLKEIARIIKDDEHTT